MADDIQKKVILDFQSNVSQITQEMSDLQKQMNLLSREQKQLQQDFKDGIVTEEEYTRGMLASENQMKDYQSQMKVLSARSFKELAGAFKEGVLGANSLGEAFVNAGKVSSQALRMLFANPLGIVITLATGLVSAIGKIVSKNDTLATSFGKLKDLATIPFKLLLQLLDPIAKGIGFVVDKINTFVGRISTMGRELNAITDLTEDLEDAQNQYNLAAAATSITLNELKGIYDDSTRPIIERIEALKEAKKQELALAQLQNDINQMELQRAVLEAKNDQKWKDHQKAALDLIQYDPAKTLQENIENFEWQMGKLGDLDQELKDKIYKSYTAYVTSQNAISNINAEYIRKESSLVNKLGDQTAETAEDTGEKVEDILNKNREIADATQAAILANYDDIERLNRKYNYDMEQRAVERNRILLNIEKSKSVEQRQAYQEQLHLFDDFTAQLTAKYYQEIAKVSTKLPTPDTNEIIDSLKTAGYEINTTLGDFTSDFASMVNEDVDSVEFNLDLLNEKTKNWVNTNAENINMSAEVFGSMADICASASQMIQSEYDAIMAKGDDMTASDIAQAKALAKKQKTLADAQIVLNQVMAIGNALVAASSAAAQSGIAAPIVFAATLATLTASIVGMISQLKQNSDQFNVRIEELNNIKKEKGFSTGGYIEGAGTATSDSIPARLSNGEAVINARSTSMFYDLLSRINQAGGGVAFPNAQNSPILHFARGGVANNTQTIIDAIKTTINGVQPVVSVKEITRVQNRLKLKEI